MRILVIGGTRFIGAAAVRQLAAAGHRLCVFNRGKSAAAPPPGVFVLHGDRNLLEDHAPELLAFAPDVLLDMCCITAAQCERALSVFAGRVPRCVFISSCDVYRTYGVLHGREDWPADNSPQAETAPLRTVLYPYREAAPRAADDPRRILDDYDKIPCEQAVLSTPSMACTVLRLPMVYGPADYQQRLLPYLRRIDDGRPAIPLGATQARWRGARGYVQDVAAAITLAVTDERAAGRVYNVAEVEAVPERAWVERIAAAAGWDGQIVEVDDSAIPDGMESLRGSAQHLMVDSSLIRSELGYREPTLPEQAIADSIAWQRAHYPDPLPEGMFDYTAEDALLTPAAGPA